MYCLLILSYFIIAVNLVLTRKYCLESQYKEDEDENNENIDPEDTRGNDLNL